MSAKGPCLLCFLDINGFVVGWDQALWQTNYGLAVQSQHLVFIFGDTIYY